MRNLWPESRAPSDLGTSVLTTEWSRGSRSEEVHLKAEASYEVFEKLQIVLGKIVEVEDFDRARKPTYKVRVDFGSEIGERRSSVQAKREYPKDELMGMLVVAIVNFPAKNIAGFMSEALILGVPAEDGSLSLLSPTRGGLLGGEVY